MASSLADLAAELRDGYLLFIDRPCQAPPLGLVVACAGRRGIGSLLIRSILKGAHLSLNAHMKGVDYLFLRTHILQVQHRCV